MNQLDKLIEQYERENPDLPKAVQWVNSVISFYADEFVKWQASEIEKLASRPTCTANERKFLDAGGYELIRKALNYITEAKALHYKNTTNSLVDDWITRVKELVSE